MRQEVVSYEEAKEYEIIDNSFEVESKGNLDVLELEIEVLSQHCNFDELKLHFLCLLLLLRVLKFLSTALLSEMASLLAPSASLIFVLYNCLPQNKEMRFMSA